MTSEFERGPRRRALLTLGAAWLAGCGGGGGGGGGGSPPPAGGARGTLVYANSSRVAVWNLDAGRGIEFDPGPMDDLGGGVSVAPDGTIAVMLAGDNQSFGFATFDLAGRRTGLVTLQRELAFQTSVLAFDASGTRVAFSVNELTSPTDATRIDRTYVHRWPDGALLAVLPGWQDPVWAGATGELVLRQPDSNRLRLFDAALQDQGWLAGLVAQPDTGSFTLSPDGRYVVLEDGSRLLAHDRQTGTRWVAAERISAVFSPTFAPDGRTVAVHAIDLATATPTFFTRVPHLVPFVPGTTVALDITIPRVDDGIVFTADRMGWLP